MKEDVLEKIILETVDVPSLPPVASKVLQLVSSDFTSINQLEEIISQDESFSTRLLRIANSPYYGRGRGIDTISTAIILIGFSSMKSLVAAASLKDSPQEIRTIRAAALGAQPRCVYCGGTPGG